MKDQIAVKQISGGGDGKGLNTHTPTSKTHTICKLVNFTLANTSEPRAVWNTINHHQHYAIRLHTFSAIISTNSSDQVILTILKNTTQHLLWRWLGYYSQTSPKQPLVGVNYSGPFREATILQNWQNTWKNF